MDFENSAPANPYSVPPGLLGELAQFIFAAAPRPVPEIALAGAVGLMAGICGRSYNVSSPPIGLNQYMLLLAPTGTGKEAISSGITILMKSIRQNVPASVEFVGPASIASPQALVKHLANTSPSFVSVLGEFGLTMQQMANPKAPSHLVGLRQIMLDLYSKSGANGELRSSIYSDRDKNTPTVQSPAFSIVAESTPESFYAGLSERFVTDGLLPRFTIIDYRGDRPHRNEAVCTVPQPELTQKLATLSAYALSLNQSGQLPVSVNQTVESQIMFDDFDQYADEQIRGSEEVSRQLWNRAHIKALKLAALVAVGCHPYEPTITQDLALWAIQIEKANVRNLLARFESGEVGETSNEELRIRRVMDAITTYCLKSWSELKSYDVRGQLHENRIITYTYIHKKLSSTAPFKKQYNQEPTKLIKESIRILVERGDIVEISRSILSKDYQFNGVAYMIANPNAFGI